MSCTAVGSCGKGLAGLPAEQGTSNCYSWVAAWEQSPLPNLLPFPCETFEPCGICRNRPASGLSEKLLMGHCKGNTHSGVFKSHIFAASGTTAGLNSLSSFFLDTRAINFPNGFCVSSSLYQPRLSFAGTSVCIIVTEQSSHQNRVKTKLERKGEKKWKKVCF